MERKLEQKWFTLIELMVIIAIIWILVSAWTQIDLNKITDDNKLIIFNNQIISQFELIRNNTLLWRWIDIDVWVPDSWKLTYSSIWSWTITPSYLSWWTWAAYSWSILQAPELHSISQINCLDISWTPINSGVTNADMIIKWNKFTLSWSCTANSGLLEFTTKFRNDTAVIEINTLNWLIEVQ